MQHKRPVSVVIRCENRRTRFRLPDHLEEFEIEQGLFVNALPTSQQGIDVHIHPGIQIRTQAGLHQIQRVEGLTRQRIGDLTRSELAIPGSGAFLVPEIEHAGEFHATGCTGSQNERVEFRVDFQEGVQHHLGEIDAIDHVVADIKAIQDVQRIAAIEKAIDAEGIEPEAERDIDIHTASESGLHTRINEFPEVDPRRDRKIGRCVHHQIHRLAHDQIQDQRKVAEQRNLERVIGVLELVQETLGTGRTTTTATCQGLLLGIDVPAQAG